MTESLEWLAKHFGAGANAKIVFGEPVRAGQLTVIPVARIAYGFGGGGGGIYAQPAGAIEIGPRGTRYLDFGWRKKVAAGLLLGIALGMLAGRIRGIFPRLGSAK